MLSLRDDYTVEQEVEDMTSCQILSMGRKAPKDFLWNEQPEPWYQEDGLDCEDLSDLLGV